MLAVSNDWRTPTVVIVSGAVGALGLSWFANSGLAQVVANLVALYLLGYVTGSLLVDWRDEAAPLSWALVRSIAGLLLATISFVVSLVFSLPWFVGPIATLACAVAARRSSAFLLPRVHIRLRLDGAIGGLLALALVSPIVISAMTMAPGDFPPVFFNVDTPYSLEKVHAMARTSIYPPESLSNLGGRPIYHLGIQAMAALLVRITGIAPHQALFLIVLPVLTLGSVAAAGIAAQGLGASVPRAVAVPLLLTAVPSFWYPFWPAVWPPLREAFMSRSIAPFDDLTRGYELWGVASIVGHNVGAQFLVVATLAALTVVSVRGWRLTVFLVGTAIWVKAPTGVALLSGFLLAQGYRVIATRSLQPLIPAVAAAMLFGATYVVFFVLPSVPVGFQTELFPFYHLQFVEARNGLSGLGLDLAWVLAPALILWGARGDGSKEGSLAFFALGIAPLIVVNVTRSLDIRPGHDGATNDWLQVLLPVPLLMRAFVLHAAGSHWARLGRLRRRAFLALVVMAIVPPAFVAAKYSRLLLREPQSGHEFVDNRSIAAALASIPVKGSVIVTNDLRYPAQNFGRENRQMQIPSLFGHQAFAVNSAYEVYEFSSHRGELQKLLTSGEWSNAIDEAATTNGWTHLLIRKDFAHPSPIPFEPLFENDSYAVYRFDSKRAVRSEP